ncbi:MAG TPA: YbhB/YbcL family Raf kinase inhibitor-like protein [Longimicrobiales bacterium]|nr:YbhB/YbcL family Raf kinase inhibitor-like protein [Longimicrobiales bacterium]
MTTTRYPRLTALAAPALWLACAPASDAPSQAASEPFTLTSAAFVESAVIPTRYAGDGENVSPPLRWRGAPAGTQSFALVMVDPDVPWGETVQLYGQMPPPGTQPADFFIHWIVTGIPVTTTSLADGASPGNMPAGTLEPANSFALFGGAANQYGGPAPPPGRKAHAYRFVLYALDVASLAGLTAESDFTAVTQAMAGHVLAATTLTGYFGH